MPVGGHGGIKYRAYALAALALVLPPLPASAAPYDAGRLSREMLVKVRAASPGKTVAVDPADPLKLDITGSKPDDHFTIYLDRIWHFCSVNTEKDCKALQDSFIANLLAPRPDSTIASLRFVVRQRAILDSAGPEMADPKSADHLIFQPIGADLMMLLVSDSKNAIAYITSKSLKDLAISEDEAWAVASAQTRSKLPRLPGGSTIASKWQGYQGPEYIASLLGLTEDWMEISRAAGADLFVTAASDQLVLAGTIKDGPELDRLAKAVVDDCNAAERCVSPHVYRFVEGKWVIVR